MARFHGFVQGNKEASAVAGIEAGLVSEARAHNGGKIVTMLSADPKTGEDVALVFLDEHNGKGTRKILYEGTVVGKSFQTPFITKAVAVKRPVGRPRKHPVAASKSRTEATKKTRGRPRTRPLPPTLQERFASYAGR